MVEATLDGPTRWQRISHPFITGVVGFLPLALTLAPCCRIDCPRVQLVAPVPNDECDRIRRGFERIDRLTQRRRQPLGIHHLRRRVAEGGQELSWRHHARDRSLAYDYDREFVPSCAVEHS